MRKLQDRVVFRDHPKSKVFLSPKEKGDAERAYQWANDQDVARFVTLRFPMTMTQEEAWCTGAADMPAHPTDVVAAIIDKKTGSHIGNIGLHAINWVSRSATTGAMIGDKRYWGQGYGSHAKLLLLKYAFEDLGLHSIESRVVAFNGRSAAYNRKCGYREVGIIPERTLRDGKLYGDIIMETRPQLFYPVWKQFEAGQFGKKKRVK